MILELDTNTIAFKPLSAWQRFKKWFPIRGYITLISTGEPVREKTCQKVNQYKALYKTTHIKEEW